jgi:hypothetical protein
LQNIKLNTIERSIAEVKNVTQDTKDIIEYREKFVKRKNLKDKRKD